MKIPKPVVCAICGLALCACIQLRQIVEGLHPQEALPVEPPHTHVEYQGTARIELASAGVSGSTSRNLPPGNFVMSNDTRRVDHYAPASRLIGPVNLVLTSTTAS